MRKIINAIVKYQERHGLLFNMQNDRIWNSDERHMYPPPPTRGHNPKHLLQLLRSLSWCYRWSKSKAKGVTINFCEMSWVNLYLLWLLQNLMIALPWDGLGEEFDLPGWVEQTVLLTSFATSCRLGKSLTGHNPRSKTTDSISLFKASIWGSEGGETRESAKCSPFDYRKEN